MIRQQTYSTSNTNKKRFNWIGLHVWHATSCTLLYAHTYTMYEWVALDVRARALHRRQQRTNSSAYFRTISLRTHRIYIKCPRAPRNCAFKCVFFRANVCNICVRENTLAILLYQLTFMIVNAVGE